MDESKQKHLELIQDVITRMATNSFLLKGWTITLVSALFALASTNTNSIFILLALFPSLILWGLDSYYLRQERLLRKLYDGVRKNDNQLIEKFSMDTSAYNKNVDGLFGTMFSKTEGWFYGLIIAVIAGFLCIAPTIGGS